jgi:hypothetical protein
MDQDSLPRIHADIRGSNLSMRMTKNQNQKKKAKSDSCPERHKMSSGVNQSLEVEKQSRIAQEVMDEYRETLTLLAKK